MHPVLFHIGPVTVYTYGFFVALGFFVGIEVARREAHRLGQSPAVVGDLCFFILIGAIVGARLFYVAVEWPVFLRHPLDIFKIWEGGLVFYGGFMGAALIGLWYIKNRQLPLWKTMDILALGVPAGHVLGRFGCFFAGCCYGKPCHLPWCVTFTDPMSLAPRGIPLHPTQLYAAAGNFLIFCALWIFRKRKRFDGQVFWVYLLLYALMRSFVECFRGDPRGLFFHQSVSIAQIIGGGVVVLALFMLRVKPGSGPKGKAGRRGA
jgi:phosphatidylglycerol---prolipoprotein diacylglyceryl transferase